MKILAALILVLSWPLWAALPATDSFTGSDGTELTVHNASWSVNVDGFYLYGNELRAKLNSGWSTARLSAESFAADHYSKGAIGRCYEYDSAIGPAVSVAASGTTGYVVTWQSCLYLKLYKWVGGIYTVIGSYDGTLIVGDTIRLERSGTSLTVTQNGTTRIGPVTDSDIVSGSAGVMGFDGTSDATRANRIDNWEGGNISAPPPPGAGGIITVCASGCDQTSLQIAINNAAAQDAGPQVIILKAGENFDTASGFTLPARSGSYTGWITLRSSRVSELPAKTRVAPADVAKLATLRVTSGGYSPALYTTGHPSSYWRLEGLEFTLSTTSLDNTGWLIGLGYGTDEAETEPSKISHHFVIDRCYVHGIAFDNGPQDGIRVNADDVEILNSYISEIKRDNGESHGIAGYSLNGPLLVRNTFHGGAAIGSIIGGSGSANVSVQPFALRFIGNHYQGTATHRALRYAGNPQGTSLPAACIGSPGVNAQTFWKTDTSEYYVCVSNTWRLIATAITGSVCVDGDLWENTSTFTYFNCTGGVWIGGGANRVITGGTVYPFTHFWSKNRFELKKVTGALVEGNLLENCFSPTDQQQACGAILFNWVTDQDGPWATIREVSVQHNLIRRTTQLVNEGIVWSNRIGSFAHRNPRLVNVNNNLVQDGSHPSVFPALNKLSYYYYPPVGSGLGATGMTQYSHGVFAHNTIVNPLASTNYWPTGFIYSESTGIVGRTVADNVFEVGPVSSAASWTGSSGCAAFAGNWTQTTFKNNVVIQAGQEIGGGNPAAYDTADCRTWAFPWKRTGTGVWQSVTGASISGGVLTITFGGGAPGHGLLQGTKVKLAGWTPGGLNGTYTIPRLWCSSGSELTKQYYQATLCLPTAETGAVTPGTVEASADYTDWAGLNFRLAATSVYKNWATDGSDPGVNQDRVEWATAGASTGAENPYLDFRVRAVTSTTDGAILRFTAYSTAACTWTIDSTRAFSGSLGSVGQSRIGRDGTATVTGLSSNTGYWYRVTCDATTRDGQFVTTH